ncbi:unnamed protein product [Cyprideis torosa]|uniref:Uncharacterized protein n=1 Tax=Cyprideis torosa TaxID=163714 RepID=A0A7R8ZPD5_9CRUS|nr:unnamed protein product [Cyprideis torosa]CAG0898575.1 unnamed protein product [Cyprideis torosa]
MNWTKLRHSIILLLASFPMLVLSWFYPFISPENSRFYPIWKPDYFKNNRWPYYDKWGNGLLVYGTGKGELKRYKVYKPLEGYYRR